MAEREAALKVGAWLASRDFSVEYGRVLDQSGTPVPWQTATAGRPAVEQDVLALAGTNPSGVRKPVILERLSARHGRMEVEHSLRRLLSSNELLIEGIGEEASYKLAKQAAAGKMLVPLPLVIDVFGVKAGGGDVRAGVDLSAFRGDLARGVGQALLCGRVCQEAYVAVGEGESAEAVALLQGLGAAVGFRVLVVGREVRVAGAAKPAPTPAATEPPPPSVKPPAP